MTLKGFIRETGVTGCVPKKVYYRRLVRYRPDWNENRGPLGHAARKYERMAVTAQSGKGEHAIKSW